MMRSFGMLLLIPIFVAASVAEAVMITPIERAKALVIRQLVQDRELKAAGFVADEIEKLLGKIEIAPKRKGRHIDSAELRAIYRKNFLHAAGYARGREYLAAHLSEFMAAEKTYGVSREVLAAILWVETGFGKNLGEHQALTALFSEAVRAVAYGANDKKISGHTSQLKSFLFLTRRLSLDPQSIYGSYAGALGIPQFMPSSYLVFAVDGDHDGKIDLFHNSTDAIMSAANYLAIHGFTKNARRAVLAYNHSGIYADTVLEYAEKISNQTR